MEGLLSTGPTPSSFIWEYISEVNINLHHQLSVTTKSQNKVRITHICLTTRHNGADGMRGGGKHMKVRFTPGLGLGELWKTNTSYFTFYSLSYIFNKSSSERTHFSSEVFLVLLSELRKFNLNINFIEWVLLTTWVLVTLLRVSNTTYSINFWIRIERGTFSLSSKNALAQSVFLALLWPLEFYQELTVLFSSA